MVKKKGKFKGGKSRGAAVIETFFTLPLVIYLMFFAIELIKINIAQDALQSICEEATYCIIAHDYTNGEELVGKINGFVDKYRPGFISKDCILWYIESYKNIAAMTKKQPYGGTSIACPSQSGVSSCWTVGSTEFIPVLGKECPQNLNKEDIVEVKNDKGEVVSIDGTPADLNLPDNRVFVLTIVCDYHFSSGVVKSLFNGGTNTRIAHLAQNSLPGNATGARGTKYLLWARGAGIVNVK